MIPTSKTSGRTRQRGHTLSTCVQFLLKPCVPCASPPASFLFSRLSGLVTTELTLSCLRCFLFPSKFPPFPACVYIFCAIPCASSPPLRPPRSRPRSRPRSHPYICSYLRHCSCFRPWSSPRSHSALALWSPPPPPLPSPPRSHLAFIRSPPPFVLVPAPDQRPRPRLRPRP